MSAVLSGCLALAPGPKSTPRPTPRPVKPVYSPSVASLELAKYYADLEQDLLTRGLLRTDGGGPETPYDAEDLAERFETLAFYDEYAAASDGGAGGLGRWEVPVILEPVFGPSVSAAQAARDRDMLTAYAARLARVTGHPVSVGSKGNFTVIFAGLDDADFTEARVRKLLPNLSASDLALFTAPPRKFYCLVTAGGPRQDPLNYSRGVALIRAEQPGLMRESCIHEEVAQGLGLRNDSPKARPSIFNDDDEFARLTSHDEKLLQMLYDRRLRVGMSAAEARPVVTRIAQEVMGELTH
ncbi:DUF2927 domain-containing protein [Phaeobacter sp. HF9A]|uniref:DUF2927 domain-containing protein n=1 Tax=Phaeobacter sp. HF9A TaxID=2721561 RepID=UPI0014320D4D|nr:DUF2927 domain-containing protein [Phaeobacter sp. HF9A]NIZ15683.1 DUF2927 domain-containing protein [Phaeobacter sp. HF9A]